MATKFSNTNLGTDKKTSSITNHRLGHTGIKEESPNADAEMLLKALRNLIIPLVRPSDRGYQHNAAQSTLGPGGEEFVTALQKFITSFLHSQRGPAGGIEADLHEKDEKIADIGARASEASRTGLSPKYASDVPHGTKPPPDRAAPGEITTSRKRRERVHFKAGGLTYTEDADIFEQRRQQFIEKLRKELREHISNVMPIRLLCFKPHISKLKIKLIERDEIYAHIASNIENNFDFLEVYGELVHPWYFLGGRTPEEVVIEKFITKYSRYAILSHTWLRGASAEVTYNVWNGMNFDTQQPGYRKLVNFCRTAWNAHGVTFGWMDTICINKESSAELDESIRSMYKWYSKAHVCITYLAETVTLSDMSNDAWFTRGWTLQELLAPSYIKFYNSNWEKLVASLESDKKIDSIRAQIKEATTITAVELEDPVRWIPISRKMEMAAKRQVTREEDIAYSLMGIFDVSISIAYGEGSERSFLRLLQEILNSSNWTVTDIFNWGSSFDAFRADISALLPSNPRGYLRRSSQYPPNIVWQRPIEPFMLTHLGLRVTVMLMPAISSREDVARRHNSIGDYHAKADFGVFHIDPDTIPDVRGGSYSVLDSRISGDDGWKGEEISGDDYWYGEEGEHKWFQLTLGILNIAEGNGREIAVPKLCLAIALDPASTTRGTIGIPSTEGPIIFSLNKRPSSDLNENEHNDGWYHIERSELANHGMKLATLYL